MLTKVLTEYLRTLHHRRSVRILTAASLFVGLPVIGFYAYFFAVKKIKLDYVPLRLLTVERLKGLKICQISDLHYGPTNKDRGHFEKAIDMINNQAPDLVVLTGDFYQWDPSFLYSLPNILARIRAKIGVFGCLGNHDYGSCYPGENRNDPFEPEVIVAAFANHGIRLLANEAIELTYSGETFNLVGLHDLWSQRFDPDTAFQHVNTEHPTIVLSHNPDTSRLVTQSFDLMLSGHCHGGQVRWPFVGALSLPIKYKEYARGLHKISERKTLYVNRGLGHIFRMRLNSSPEVTLIEFV